MSNKCACCGSNVPEAAYGCFACGAPRDQAPGPMGICPRCQYRLMQGARMCPGCNLGAEKIQFGAAAQPAAQHTAPPHQSAVTYAPPPPPKQPKPPKSPKQQPPPQAEGATGSNTKQYIIIGAVLGGAIILAGALTFLQYNPQLLASLAPPAQITAPQQPQQPQPAPTTPARPGIPTQAAAEAHLLADPIDGPFFGEFRDLLPADYAAMMSDLLAQVPDPARDMAGFDKLLGKKLEDLRIANAAAIGGAEDSVLDEMAGNMLMAMRAPEYCQAAIDPAGGGLDPGNTVTRRLGAKISLSIVRAIASGRKHAIVRPPLTAAQHASFQSGLEARLYDRQWEAYQTGTMANLPPDEQCAIYVAHWTLIAGYGPALSAAWTADQMKQPAE